MLLARQGIVAQILQRRRQLRHRAYQLFPLLVGGLLALLGLVSCVFKVESATIFEVNTVLKGFRAGQKVPPEACPSSPPHWR